MACVFAQYFFIGLGPLSNQEASILLILNGSPRMDYGNIEEYIYRLIILNEINVHRQYYPMRSDGHRQCVAGYVQQAALMVVLLYDSNCHSLDRCYTSLSASAASSHYRCC